jgi:hypothetical protein
MDKNLWNTFKTQSIPVRMRLLGSLHESKSQFNDGGAPFKRLPSHSLTKKPARYLIHSIISSF